MKKLLLSLSLGAAAVLAHGVAIGPIDDVDEPSSVSVYSGEQVTMSAQVLNGADSVHLTVLDANGEVHYEYDLAPDPDGYVEFSWFPLFDGTFRVEASSTLGGFPLGSESLAFVSAVRPDAVGFITGGGWFDEGSGKTTFGFVAQVMKNGSIRGNLEFQDHFSPYNWKSTSLDWVYVATPQLGYFSGWATQNGSDVYRFFVEVQDWGEPGRADTFRFWVYDPLDGSLKYQYEGALTGGNIQIHVR